jgi:hypothetical protein
MTASATAAPGQCPFDPDTYLDCRQPGWEVYEDRGLVRFERPLGSKRSLVFVDDDCTEVLEALRSRGNRGAEARR